jgi:hypothetical protein
LNEEGKMAKKSSVSEQHGQKSGRGGRLVGSEKGDMTKKQQPNKEEEEEEEKTKSLRCGRRRRAVCSWLCFLACEARKTSSPTLFLAAVGVSGFIPSSHSH